MNRQDKPRQGRTKLPKGAYRLPTGGFVSESRHQVGKRRITIHAVHKDPLDYELLARAFLEVADKLNREERKP